MTPAQLEQKLIDLGFDAKIAESTAAQHGTRKAQITVAQSMAGPLQEGANQYIAAQYKSFVNGTIDENALRSELDAAGYNGTEVVTAFRNQAEAQAAAVEQRENQDPA